MTNPNPTENDCPAEETLLDYAAGRLHGLQSAEFEGHAATCASCSEFRATQALVWQTLDDWKPVAVSEGFNRELWRRIDADQQAGFGGGFLERFRQICGATFRTPLAPVALVAVLAVTGLVMDRSRHQAPEPATAVVVTPSDADQIERALDDVRLLRDVETASQVVKASPGVL